MSTTTLIREVLPDLPFVVGPYDPDKFVSGHAAYLREARLKTALARWHDACPPELRETEWSDENIAPYAAQHAAIRDWLPNASISRSPKGLIAAGLTGRGKSRAMWSLMRRLAETGNEIRYFTAAQWFSKLQSQVNYGRDDALGWVAAVAAAPIVFIDDLGQEAISTNKQEWCAGWLFQFLDMRLGNGLPLFVTTNLNAQEMAGTAGATRANPLVRRLLELCEPVKF